MKFIGDILDKDVMKPIIPGIHFLHQSKNGLPTPRQTFKQAQAEAHLTRCGLAIGKGRYREVIEYSIKAAKLDLSPEINIAASRYMVSLAESLPQMDTPTRNHIQGRLKNFITQYVTLERIAKMDLEEKNGWLITIHLPFTNQFLPQQLSLAEDIFSKTEKEGLKGDAASIYLLAALHLDRIRNQSVDSRMVRKMAEFVIEKLVKIIQTEWDDEVFHTFMGELDHFKLWDLEEKALAIRKPKADDPIWFFLRLSQKFRENIDTAFEETRLNFPLKGEFNRIIFAELSILCTRITRAYLEKNLMSAGHIRLDRSGLSFAEQLLLERRSQHPEIMKEIQGLRKAALSRIQVLLSENGFGALSVESNKPHQMGNDKDYLLFAPDLDHVELYLSDARDKKFIKVKYPVIRKPNGDLASISPVSRFENGENNPLLLLEYLTLSMFLKCKAAGDHRPPEKELEKITGLIDRGAHALFLKENRESCRELESSCRDFPPFQAQLLELGNRLDLCARILKEFKPSVSDSYFKLDSSDLLFPLIKGIELSLQNELVFPARVIFELQSGRILEGVAHGADKLEIFGGGPEDPLLTRYLLELSLEALVKCRFRNRLKKSKALSGYIVDVNGNYADPPSHKKGLDLLLKIYRSNFYQQLREKGLLNFTWLYQKGALFYPLKNQTGKGKQKALEEIGKSKLFIQVEPTGLVVRLRVGKKRVKKELLLAPWERDTLREEQQKLLGDNRPLPTLYGLYIITTFSDGSKHVYPFAIREEEKELLSDALFKTVEQKIKQGFYQNPDELLKHTRSKALRQKLESGQLLIVSQEPEIFELNTTFRRPALVPIAKLLDKSIPL